jgi:predicted flap endonuclease-1-like 5' DNA nuclease
VVEVLESPKEPDVVEVQNSPKEPASRKRPLSAAAAAAAAAKAPRTGASAASDAGIIEIPSSQEDDVIFVGFGPKIAAAQQEEDDVEHIVYSPPKPLPASISKELRGWIGEGW